MRPADRLEEPKVRPAQPFLVGDLDQAWGPRVLDLVDRVAEARDVGALLAGPSYGLERERVPPGVVGGQVAVVLGEDGVQVTAAVLGHAEEPRAAPEQPGGQRALQ